MKLYQFRKFGEDWSNRFRDYLSTSWTTKNEETSTTYSLFIRQLKHANNKLTVSSKHIHLCMLNSVPADDCLNAQLLQNLAKFLLKKIDC